MMQSKYRAKKYTRFDVERLLCIYSSLTLAQIDQLRQLHLPKCHYHFQTGTDMIHPRRDCGYSTLLQLHCLAYELLEPLLQPKCMRSPGAVSEIMLNLFHSSFHQKTMIQRNAPTILCIFALKRYCTQ